MKEYRNYIFDLYGTLIDIHTDEEQVSLWEKMTDVYRQYDLNYEPLELKRLYHVLCHKEDERIRHSFRYPEIKLEKVFEALLKGRNGNVEEICWKFRQYSTIHMHLYPYTVNMLENLKRNNKRIYLLSNAQKYFTEKEMEITGIKPYFDDIFISSVMGVKKPDPQFMGMLLDKHQLDIKQSVMIGNDITTDCLSSDNYDMDSIYINTFDLSEDNVNELISKNLKRPQNVTVIMDWRQLKG